MIRITLLGTPGLHGPEGPVHGRAAQRMRLAFLAILAAQKGSAVSRDRLIGLLWPEHDGDRARRLLSEALYVVRKELGDEVIVAGGDDLRLDPRALPSDLEAFRAALTDDRPEAAVEAYGGPFLDGFFIDGSPAFEKWVDEERADLARAYAGALRKLARAAADAGDARAAAGWWRRLAAHDRFDASVALGLMQALVAAGNRAAAIRHAQVHASLLRHELEIRTSRRWRRASVRTPHRWGWRRRRRRRRRRPPTRPRSSRRVPQRAARSPAGPPPGGAPGADSRRRRW